MDLGQQWPLPIVKGIGIGQHVPDMDNKREYIGNNEQQYPGHAGFVAPGTDNGKQTGRFCTQNGKTLKKMHHQV
jgi:hypothetical protein